MGSQALPSTPCNTPAEAAECLFNVLDQKTTESGILHPAESKGPRKHAIRPNNNSVLLGCYWEIPLGSGVPFTESKHTDEGEMTCMIQANVGMYEHLKYVPAMYPIHNSES